MLGSAVCSICTDVYDSERSVAAMPCGHTFHDECLEKWLRNTRNCPSCRKPLKKTQQPIHRLFFDSDHHNLSQQRSPTSSGKADENRKLKVQVNALQSAIQKLKSECQEAQSESASLACAIIEKDEEIRNLNRSQEKLRRKVREFSGTREELGRVAEQLDHLKNVQTIVEGVESDVKRMLEEKAGYNQQQLTYIVLLRQQLDNSKRANDKLRKDMADLREKLSVSERKNVNTVMELDILRLELKQAEHRNITLKRKCEALIRSINSPRGVASSLAQRMINQSPAPQCISPLTSSNSGQVNVSKTSTPALYKKSAADDSAVNSSPDLFADASSLCLADDDVVKQTLSFNDDRLEQATLTDTSNQPDKSSAASDFGKQIKLKPVMKTKKLKLKPIHPIGTSSVGLNSNSQVKDITNTHPTSTSVREDGTRGSKFFRQGYDGLGGQSQTFNKVQTAVQFNVFKKPASTKAKLSYFSVATKRPHTATVSGDSGDEIIILD